VRGLVLKLLGVASVALGGLTLSGRLTLPRDRQTIDLGVIQATAETRQRLPDWVGFGALGVGVVLLLGGGRSRE
jgi:hypothetical protein